MWLCIWGDWVKWVVLEAILYFLFMVKHPPPRPARDVNSMRAGILVCMFTIPFVSRLVPNTQ